MKYQSFLESKINLDTRTGFDICLEDINPILFPHQRDIVQWAIAGGRRAIFAAFGLGKTFIQIECLRLIGKKEGGKYLIIAPLGVRQEFKRDAVVLEQSITFIRRTDELKEDGLYITNYESVRDGKLDVNQFNAVSLDEASVLRSYGSKTYQNFLTLFGQVKYRFVATATPSPNKYKELIHYAGFLGVMDTGQALTRFFQRDSTKANNLTLYPHKEKEFWYWISSWAIFLQRPSDIGYSDEGYDLPELHIHYHEVETDIRECIDRDGQMQMFNDAALSLKEAAREKRDSIEKRVNEASRMLYDYENSLNSGFNNVDERAKEQAIQSVVSGKQSRVVEKTEDTKRTELQGQPGKIQSQSKSMEGSEPRENKGITKNIRGKEQREAQKEIGGLVSEQQGKGGKTNKNKQIKKIRPNDPIIRENKKRTEQQMLDMPGRSNRSLCGSLSQDREDSRLVMQDMQCSDRSAQRLPEGVEKSSEIHRDQYIIWVELNDEQKTVERMLRNHGITYSSLYGSQDIDKREKLIIKWKNKETQVFLSKPDMYGSGINMQQCNKMIFLGIGYKFNSFIQALHRIHRFLQTKECHIHLIYADTEREILKTLEQKWAQHKIMVGEMTNIIKEYGLSHSAMQEELRRSIGVDRIEVTGDHFKVVNNDCVEETKSMEDNSIDLIHTSIPFSNHYEYTPSYNDFGHNENNDKFFDQMDYLTPELLRVLKPGRVAAIHVKDRILFGNVTGYGMPSVDPFHVICINHYRDHGFIYFGMITVVTDVVRENNQTYRLGWTEQCKDGSKMGVGSPEYILLFRKLPTDTTRAYADEKVAKSKEEYTRAQWQVDAHAFWRSSGDRLLVADELAKLPPDKISKIFTKYTLENIYDYEAHIKIGKILDEKGTLPSTFMTLAPGSNSDYVWHDVNRMRTLNGDQTRRGLNNHICPLQFDIVDRIINRYSNNDDVIYDPFGGLMTVPYRAILLGRQGRAAELNPQYFFDGIKYLQAAERERDMPSLFDDIEDDR